MSNQAPAVLDRARVLVQPALRAAVDRLADERMRLVAGYHLGWLDAAGREVHGGGGKAVRPALVLLCAEAAGGAANDAVAPAVAIELVHNFSLLHDDIMDRDVERRHRATAWTVFGEGQALLAGTAMLTAAVEVLTAAGPAGHRGLPCLLDAVQRLISGQSEDLALEGRADADLDAVLHMEAGKTAALLSCSAALGALAVDAPPAVVAGLAAYGHELGMAFQLIDDILGITGDSAVTGKSASSDVRAGKRSAPIVAALSAGTDASSRLARHYLGGPPATEDDVTEATKLIDEAGGLECAAREADRRLAQALAHLDALAIVSTARDDLAELARYVVDRDQ
jgi:geranylgeranyl diphosphate synthase, type I